VDGGAKRYLANRQHAGICRPCTCHDRVRPHTIPIWGSRTTSQHLVLWCRYGLTVHWGTNLISIGSEPGGIRWQCQFKKKSNLEDATMQSLRVVMNRKNPCISLFWNKASSKPSIRRSREIEQMKEPDRERLKTSFWIFRQGRREILGIAQIYNLGNIIIHVERQMLSRDDAAKSVHKRERYTRCESRDSRIIPKQSPRASI
jgi:hypothetical protein